jgi:serine/threonine-protein kinase
MTIDSRHRLILANRYQLIELVGSGAMGQVYRAEDKLLGGVTVAIKFLSQALLSQRMRERFEREATISALLGEKSIHIVRVRDYGVDEKEIPFYVMEYLQGESLSEIIKFRHLHLSRFLNIARQICLGLECAHKGIIFGGEMCPIVHRDIKPSNIIVLQDATLGELAKILDFGIATLVQTQDQQTHSFMGTLAYSSPEQMEGKELDNRSDIYSLGIIMYEMLMGELPIFPEQSSFARWYEAHHYTKPQPFNPNLNLPPALENLIYKCLAKAPQERPQSISELLQVLEIVEAKQKDNRSSFLSPPTATANNDKVEEELPSGNFLPPSVEELCRQVSWPKDKPHQKIVFSQSVHTSQGIYPSLWVMLDQQDIVHRLSSIRYNQFLFLTNPHPMLLWITVLYHPEYGPRWLPCYLDLKTSSGQTLTRLLGSTGSYWILFFALENPQQCQKVISSTIAPIQCKNLQEWADNSQILRGGKPQITKRMLRQELEKLKPRILKKLEAIRTEQPKDLSGL